MYQSEFRAMGCQMLALLDTTDPTAAVAIQHVPIWFEAWEQQLSRFRAESELSRLNRTTGQAIAVSQTLWEVLDLAIDAAEQSNGLVTPTMLPALEAAGYNRSFELINASVGNTAPEIAPNIAHEWRNIQRNQRAHTVRLPYGVRIDLGGVAKGWAADMASTLLSASGPALIDAGGDIAISGPQVSGAAWQIGVASPFEPEQDLCILAVSAGGVATSGRDYRRWLQNGVWQHHIIDPRTGQPAQTDIISATVIAPTASIAEVAAKAAFILGSEAGLEWINQRPQLAGLLVRENGTIQYSERLESMIIHQP